MSIDRDNAAPGQFPDLEDPTILDLAAAVGDARVQRHLVNAVNELRANNLRKALPRLVKAIDLLKRPDSVSKYSDVRTRTLLLLESLDLQTTIALALGRVVDAFDSARSADRLFPGTMFPRIGAIARIGISSGQAHLVASELRSMEQEGRLRDGELLLTLRILEAHNSQAEGRTRELLDLAATAHLRTELPLEAAEHVARDVARLPGFGKLRGMLYVRAWLPTQARQVLDEALELAPNDGEALFWRARARMLTPQHLVPVIMQIVSQSLGETDSTDGGERTEVEALLAYDNAVRVLPQVIGDLLAALALDPADQQSRRLLMWCLDRAIRDTGLFFVLTLSTIGLKFQDDSGSPYPLLQRAFPDLRELSGAFAYLNMADPSAQERLEVYGKAAQIADRLQIPAAQARARLGMAAAQYELDNIQAATDLLDDAQAYASRYLAPLLDFDRDEDHDDDALSRARGVMSMQINIDYAVLDLQGRYQIEREIDQWRQDIRRLIAAPSGTFPRSDIRELPLREAIARISDLRRVDPAEALLNLEQIWPQWIDSGEASTALLYSERGLVLGALNRTEEARSAFLEAIAATSQDERDRQRRCHIIANLSTTLLQLGEAENVLNVLSEHGFEIEHFRRGQRALILTNFAQAHLLRGDAVSALDCIRIVVDLIEELRSDLNSVSERRTWLTRWESVYELGVEVAVDADDAALAFEIAQRAKSRTLMDTLVVGPLSAQRLEELARPAARNLRRSLSMRLMLLTQVVDGNGDYRQEIVDQLRQVNESIEPRVEAPMQIFSGGDGVESVFLPEALAEELASVRNRLALLDEELEVQAFRALPGTSYASRQTDLQGSLR